MKQRFCPYGQHFVDDVGFKFIPHLKSNTMRGMCPSCQATRRLSRERLAEMTQEEKEARRNSSAAASRQALEKRKEGL